MVDELSSVTRICFPENDELSYRECVPRTSSLTDTADLVSSQLLRDISLDAEELMISFEHMYRYTRFQVCLASCVTLSLRLT